jgi:hypothetical protein
MVKGSGRSLKFSRPGSSLFTRTFARCKAEMGGKCRRKTATPEYGPESSQDEESLSKAPNNVSMERVHFHAHKMQDGITQDPSEEQVWTTLSNDSCNDSVEELCRSTEALSLHVYSCQAQPTTILLWPILHGRERSAEA